jgi:hypothetical protein
MTRLASTIPAETDVLCEGCGYTLNGLSDDGRCPECGKPIAESLGHPRVPPVWERRETLQVSVVSAFIRTSAEALSHPTRFYRTLATRRDDRAARRFAQIWWWATALLLGLAAYGHTTWYLGMIVRPSSPDLWMALRWAGPVVFVAGTYAALSLTTHLAAKLTHWEASYRGLRMPLPVVLRGMYYHAVHYMPWALIGFLTVYGFRFGLQQRLLSPALAERYLYLLCAEVILAAAYLFHTYWIGMRNVMYANR